jgi:hypothetical protein
MKNVLYAFRLATLLLASAPALSKGQTERIEISGAGLATPLEITDSAILGRFNIWNGPGVRALDANGRPIPEDQERSGAFIDWPRGVVSIQASTLQRYDVVFHQGGRDYRHEWHSRYVVRYACDPAKKGGYIYLPGPKDGEDYRRNITSIYHSIEHAVEGNWFYSSAAWERLVRPLIAKALAAAHSG